MPPNQININASSYDTAMLKGIVQRIRSHKAEDSFDNIAKDLISRYRVDNTANEFHHQRYQLIARRLYDVAQLSEGVKERLKAVFPSVATSNGFLSQSSSHSSEGIGSEGRSDEQSLRPSEESYSTLTDERSVSRTIDNYGIESLVDYDHLWDVVTGLFMGLGVCALLYGAPILMVSSITLLPVSVTIAGTLSLSLSFGLLLFNANEEAPASSVSLAVCV